MKPLKTINIELMRNMTDEQFDHYQKIMDGRNGIISLMKEKEF